MPRTFSVLAWCALFGCLLVSLLPPGVALAQQSDARLFPQTGYRIADNAFWDYFRRRGGVRRFSFRSSELVSDQILQRLVEADVRQRQRYALARSFELRRSEAQEAHRQSLLREARVNAVPFFKDRFRIGRQVSGK